MIARRLAAVLLGLGSLAVCAQTAAATDATVEQIVKRYLGWKDLCTEMRLKNIGKSGSVQEGGSKMCVLFAADGSRYGRVTVTSPAVARGMDLITRADLIGQTSGGKSQQWLYMPASQRATLINANNSESPFLGSEFSFADLDLAYLDPGGLSYVDEGACDQDRCRRYAVRAAPGALVKRIVWAVAGTGAIRQIEIQKQGKPYKTLTVVREAQQKDGWWVADEVVMRNLQTGNRTESTWKNVRFNTGLKPENFDPKKIYGTGPSGRPR